MARPAIVQMLERALAAHRGGDKTQAETLYREVLLADPNHAEANYLLGVLALEEGANAEAVARLERAVLSRPEQPAFHCNLGEAFRRLGRSADAVQSFARAVALKADFIEAVYNLGLALEETGQYEAALAAFQRTTVLQPNLRAARCKLARALVRSGQTEQAIEHFRAALAEEPAEDLELDLADALFELRRHEEALAHAKKVIAQHAGSSRAFARAAASLQALQRLDEAVALYRRVVELKPSSATALYDLAQALGDLGQVRLAIETYRQVSRMRPDSVATRSNILFLGPFDPSQDQLSLGLEARAWAEAQAAPLAGEIRGHRNDRSPDRRLRVGYVSPDFKRHVQALFTRPLLSHHDRDGFEICLYSSTDRPDAISGVLKANADLWRDVRTLDDAALAEAVRDDGIDILVDLTMHMAFGRPLLFARKPAPVQICWLAYPGTTGLSTMDYRITDRHLDPPGSNLSDYVEQSIVLPDSFWCYEPLAGSLEISPLPARSKGHVTFGCLNTFMKVTPAMVGLWAEVLRRVPGSRFILLAPFGEARERIAAIFEAGGVSRERIDFVARQSHADYEETYQKIDVCLDTLPSNGHTTSMDAFWMGVPVVTLEGKTVVGRAGVCLCMNLGLSELIARSPGEFVQIAVTLAGDLERLELLRLGLRARMSASPIMDGRRFARNLEVAYRRAWHSWCAGALPQHIVIEGSAG